MTDQNDLRSILSFGPWQAMERLTARYFALSGFNDVRVVGGSGDKGGDVIAERNGQRWVAQVKYRSTGSVGKDAVDEALNAQAYYDAQVPVISTNQALSREGIKRLSNLQQQGIRFQKWDRGWFLRRFEQLPEFTPQDSRTPRPYQLSAINQIVAAVKEPGLDGGVLLLATGLGKTFTAYTALQELREANPEIRILILAHTNELVYQLERDISPFLPKSLFPAIWNGAETGAISSSQVTIACINSVHSYLKRHGELPQQYDLVVVDEAHHSGGMMYRQVLDQIRSDGDSPFVLGLTATPWRADDHPIEDIIGPVLFTVDLVTGMKQGYLADIDYRMHVDNINWDSISSITDLTPRALNKRLFIREWDDAVIDGLQNSWSSVSEPRAIVFCGTIDHAQAVKDQINARGFARAEAIHSRVPRRIRQLTLSNFHDGKFDILCSVDVLNEGIDIPSVNIVVFQRVTHSRRIFVQQLGRGLRLSPGKDKVLVLDFVSDIRRFAAGLQLASGLSGKGENEYVQYGSPVTFHTVGGEDQAAGKFITEWLEDVAVVADSGEDESTLKFPPGLAESHS
jgi:superfamily II DNA or RNA helicase